MSTKNKTLFLIIMGFVFLFLVSRLHPSAPSSPIINDAAGINSAGAVASSSVKPKPALASAKVKNILPANQLTTEKISPEYYLVLRVVDGDTIDLLINGKTERLRLIGINTPEVVDSNKPVECFGPEASVNAEKLLAGQEVRIAADPSQDDRDVYGRLLRYVWRSDGLFYNLEAIKNGFAREYTFKKPYQYQLEFRAAQKTAQENNVGLWAVDACGKRGKKTVTAAPVKPSAKDNRCLIKGNISADGSKIYHLSDCPQYNQTVINEAGGERWFCTEAAAIAAGWRKAGNCP
jgi:micrococcal nuclease